MRVAGGRRPDSQCERNHLSPASEGATQEGSSTEPGDKPGAFSLPAIHHDMIDFPSTPGTTVHSGATPARWC